MVNCQWSIVNGQLSMINRQWSIVNRQIVNNNAFPFCHRYRHYGLILA